MLASWLFIVAFSNLRSPHAGSKPVTNLADKFLENPELIQTREQRNDAILQCLDEIADILKTRASHRAIAEELTAGIDVMVRSTEARDKDMKRRFSILQERIANLENTTRTSLSSADQQIKKFFGEVREKLVPELDGLFFTRSRAEKINTRLQSDRMGSVGRAALLFVFEQALIAAFLALYRALRRLYQ